MATTSNYPNTRIDYSLIYQLGFDWRDALRQYDPRLLVTSEGRRAITRHDPLAFALVYLRRQFTNPKDGSISFCEFHAASFAHALTWRGPQAPMSNRHAWIAPRGVGKSTIHFRTLPLWALAHKHRQYFAIFTKVSTLAEEHSHAIRTELRHNALLRLDYPDLCEPRMSRGRPQHDSVGTYLADGGAIITAKGMDSSVLGASIDGRRADVLVFDDVEPDESNYSAYQAAKRKRTIVGAIGYYNVDAIWDWVGTTTMHGGLVHDLARSVSGHPMDANAPELEWVKEQRITAHHFKALAPDEHGELVSQWPARWSTAALLEMAHRRDFKMEMQNEPDLGDEGMWQDEDITHVDVAHADTGACALFIDPAVTATEESDFTGIAITQYVWPTRAQMERNERGQVEVLYSTRIKATGGPLRTRIMHLLNAYPQVRRVVVEKNAGGALWVDVLYDLPVEVELVHATEAKETRAAWALAYYQQRPTKVAHVGLHHQLESTMKAFPLVAHDDDLDALVYGVLYWLAPERVRQPGMGTNREIGAHSMGSYVA